MKSVIVFYIPQIDQTVGSVDKIKEQLGKLKGTKLDNEFHIIIIEDPSRTNINTQVFFKSNNNER